MARTMVAALDNVQGLVLAADALLERLVRLQGGAAVGVAMHTKYGQRHFVVVPLEALHAVVDRMARTHTYIAWEVEWILLVVLPHLQL